MSDPEQSTGEIHRPVSGAYERTWELELIRRPGGVPGWYSSTKLPLRVGAEVVGLVSVSRDLDAHDVDDAVLRSLREVVALVQARLDDPPSVTELAAAGGCSPGVLSRRMHRVFGLSPQQYVLRARLDHAVELLAGDLPLAEVAHACGFYDQPAFTRTFAAHTGETPAARRAR